MRGQEVRSEAFAHTIHEIRDDNKTQAILLVDAENISASLFSLQVHSLL